MRALRGGREIKRSREIKTKVDQEWVGGGGCCRVVDVRQTGKRGDAAAALLSRRACIFSTLQYDEA